MLLALNTSTMQFSLALMEEGGSVVAEYVSAGGKGRFVHLMPTLQFLLESAQIQLKDIRCLAAALGPGSFTGLRVGLSLAKGLCHALALPLIGIPSLEAMAMQVVSDEMAIAPLLDSRRNEFFTALFRPGNNGRLVRTAPDRAVRAEEFADLFPDPALFIGNDFPRQSALLEKVLGPTAVLAGARFWGLRASSVAACALDRFHAGDFDDPRRLSPVYMRPPEIRPPFPKTTSP